MCGRYLLFAPTETLLTTLSEYLGEPVTALPGDWLRPSWNIAPTHRIAVVRRFRGRPVLGPVTWGFPAPWTTGAVLFNACGETVFDKESFRGSEPVLVVMDGWYEWSGTGAAKTPYLVSRDPRGSDHGILVVAGMVRAESRTGGGVGAHGGGGAGRTLQLYATIITTASAEPVEWLHTRMPRLLDSAEARLWLGEGAGVGEELPQDLAATIPRAGIRATLQVRAVDRRVGNVRANGPELITGP